MRAWRSLATPLLAGLCALQLLALMRAPDAWMPARVAIALERGQALALDGSALGAPAGTAPALRLRRDAQGGWWIARSGGNGALALERNASWRRSGSAVLAAGQRFQLGTMLFQVDAQADGAVSMSRGATRWRYDGATLYRDGAAQPACPDARLGTRLAATWNRIAPGALTLARPLVFGGNLDCGNRLAIPGLAAPAASVVRSRGDLLLASATESAAPALLFDGSAMTPLAGREESLDGVTTLIAGRTRLLLAPQGDNLLLQPVGHVALYSEAQLRLMPGISWSWAQRGLWTMPDGARLPLILASAAGLLAIGMLLWPQRRRMQQQPRGAWAALAGAALAGTGLALLWLQRAGLAPGAGVSLLVAWAALWLALWAPRRLPLALAAGVLLVAVGVLAQLDLGLGAPESSWLRHVQKTAALLALGVGAATAWGPLRSGAPMAQARTEALLVLLAVLALALLLLQVAFGDETGVFDMQPVEFAKLALAALTAHCLALASSGQAALASGSSAAASPLRRSLRLVTPALLFMALLSVALVQVDDYSPLILLAVWGGTMALVHALATRQRLASGLLVACACLMVLGVAGLRGAGPAQLAAWDFYADRFMVWLDPGTHPHTGQQLLLGARAVAEGGWAGVDRLFGVTALGRDAGAALRIPAVQDDFAPSFFLNRHGLAAALALWLLQASFLAGLLALALRCWQAQSHTRDFRRAWLARFRCFLLCGGAAFVFGHFLLSWGTNLAIFPVMGQPMSFLSAGGSHLLFFICPLLAFGTASAQSLEEPASCPASSQTTSSVKS